MKKATGKSNVATVAKNCKSGTNMKCSYLVLTEIAHDNIPCETQKQKVPFIRPSQGTHDPKSNYFWHMRQETLKVPLIMAAEQSKSNEVES